MPSQHKVTPLSIRLPEGERSAVSEAAEREGVPVRQWILQAIRERLSAASCAPDVPREDDDGLSSQAGT